MFVTGFTQFQESLCAVHSRGILCPIDPESHPRLVSSYTKLKPQTI